MSRETAAEYLEQLRRIARARNGVLLSRAYLGDATKLRWRCSQGHVFLQRPTSVKQGKWCRLCGWVRAAATHRAPGAEALRHIVAGRGGAILSDWHVNAVTVRFRCAQGHEWETVPGSVLRGSWCRRCSNEARTATLRDGVLHRLSELARKHGGEVLGPVIAPGLTRYQLRCAQGHLWRSLPATIEHGAWCQACVRESRLDRVRQAALQ